MHSNAIPNNMLMLLKIWSSVMKWTKVSFQKSLDGEKTISWFKKYSIWMEIYIFRLWKFLIWMFISHQTLKQKCRSNYLRAKEEILILKIKVLIQKEESGFSTTSTFTSTLFTIHGMQQIQRRIHINLLVNASTLRQVNWLKIKKKYLMRW